MSYSSFQQNISSISLQPLFKCNKSWKSFHFAYTLELILGILKISHQVKDLIVFVILIILISPELIRTEAKPYARSDLEALQYRRCDDLHHSIFLQGFHGWQSHSCRQPT